MNISPTPKRYQNPNHMPRAVNFNYQNPAPAYHDPINGHGGERIVPEEYKINSNMISSLIKQNKDLLSKLEDKERELEKLNVLVGSLRGKLIKYTELNKKLQAQAAQAARAPPPLAAPEPQQQQQQQQQQQSQPELAQDYIQLPKRLQGNSENDKKINEIYDKLEYLTNVVAQQQQQPQQQQQSSQKHSQLQTPAHRTGPSYNTVSDDDIMISESSELRKLEEQVDQLKRKVLIKSENELRKLSLNQQLVDLMGKLGVSSAQNSASANSLLYDRIPTPSSAPSIPSAGHVHTTTHCEQCHHHSEESLKRPAMDIKNALETPTPSRTKRDNHNYNSNINSNNPIW
ncbi:Spc42p Ecym_4585 [Eremothecium cymbalariae DBVPG|uniref:Spindle pole body component SPC42 n=1 Tax=Eremothecium cymbalariae (strain CBS 270.75 / DBVPG 7215 / KCTC 17166 / NRRL Y-17582) TaxID=931890 RepID=G8JS96_ERECY|nr:hypothetical protein Ecym_4585 [Eremothecium cymbalariae DBVPG\